MLDDCVPLVTVGLGVGLSVGKGARWLVAVGLCVGEGVGLCVGAGVRLNVVCVGPDDGFNVVV